VFALHIRVVIAVRRSILLPMIHTRCAALVASQIFL
jgi:hypothetical protein